jgi:DNA-binding CsgD family transcriptional regulator
MLTKGYGDKRMANILGISENGIRARLENAKIKLGVKTRAELIAKAVQHKIV